MSQATSPKDKGFGQGDPRLKEWAERRFAGEDEVLREIRARSVEEGLPEIAVGKMDGLHLEVLARAVGARTAIEIGTLGGYSGVCILRGLSPDGVLHTFELTDHHAAVARESFRRAGFQNRAHVHVGPALERLPDVEPHGPFDLVFIDADKPSYPAYLDWAAAHLREGGLLLADNAFGWGWVADASEAPPNRREMVDGLIEFNRKLVESRRFRATMIPTAEGLAMGVKLR